MTDTIEETTDFQPRFNEAGLLPVVAQEARSGEVLMLAWANALAIEKTLATGEAHYWSRSRAELWHKGATSGHVQRVIGVLTDCDQDTLIYKVEQTGAACHTGRPTCFYRAVENDGTLTAPTA